MIFLFLNLYINFNQNMKIAIIGSRSFNDYSLFDALCRKNEMVYGIFDYHNEIPKMIAFAWKHEAEKYIKEHGENLKIMEINLFLNNEKYD